MNERIKELAHEAGLPTYNPEGIPTKLEKFAQLIVRECIVDFYRNCLDTTSNEDITVQVDRYVKEHFGVE